MSNHRYTDLSDRERAVIMVWAEALAQSSEALTMVGGSGPAANILAMSTAITMFEDGLVTLSNDGDSIKLLNSDGLTLIEVGVEKPTLH